MGRVAAVLITAAIERGPEADGSRGVLRFSGRLIVRESSAPPS
jgi:hypothetical protein